MRLAAPYREVVATLEEHVKTLDGPFGADEQLFDPLATRLGLDIGQGSKGTAWAEYVRFAGQVRRALRWLADTGTVAAVKGRAEGNRVTYYSQACYARMTAAEDEAAKRAAAHLAVWERIHDELALAGYDVTSQRGDDITMTPESWLRLLAAGWSRQEG
jgi:hypothetical protein